jgi:hypothetical protein
MTPEQELARKHLLNVVFNATGDDVDEHKDVQLWAAEYFGFSYEEFHADVDKLVRQRKEAYENSPLHTITKFIKRMAVEMTAETAETPATAGAETEAEEEDEAENAPAESTEA